MTGWAQAPCSRMQPWHAWKEGGTDIELSAVTAALLRQLRLWPPPSSAAAAFPSPPAATPPLPLWQCACAAGEGVGGGWHSQRTAACGACGRASTGGRPAAVAAGGC